jgi:phospholipid/cholesterol/gamma-HCH transport system ATP-binding protein
LDLSHPILELQNVTVELSGEVIIKDVNLKIYPGEVVVIIGPSGGGKSVLLKTMAGVFEPTAGHVRVFDHERKLLSVDEKHALARKIGMQFQKSALFDELNALDNIAFVLREHTSLNEDDIRERSLECLRAVGLEKNQRSFEYELSGGMKQRLGIARSIALKPDILFLDDPTAGLDPVNADNMAEMVLNMKRQTGSTLVVVTHDILRAYQFAGRIVLVANQTVRETGSAEETQRSADPLVQQFITGNLHGPLTDGREI